MNWLVRSKMIRNKGINLNKIKGYVHMYILRVYFETCLPLVAIV